MPAKIAISPGKVDEIIGRWNKSPEFVIEMLQDVQQEFRHLPRAALRRISEAIRVPPARLYHIATFYKAFSLEPRGEIPVQVCTGTACHVRGSQRVLDAFSRELEIEPGRTTPDLRFSLEGVRCLGCCSLAPVVKMGEKVMGEIDSSKVARLLKRYTKASPGKEAGDA